MSPGHFLAPFDDWGVEASSLGNELLAGVEVRQVYAALNEHFGKQLHVAERASVCWPRPRKEPSHSTTSTSSMSLSAWVSR